ncbi:enoyl-CoA hydratase [Solimonas sp. K1W22B-7]|nr:enoyl-CoA hydratase [Solimonas sp. K1W22B-7]
MDGHIGRVGLCRPDKANAFDLAMWEELPAAFAWLSGQQGLRVAILFGEGRHFCAGIDLSVIRHLLELASGNACSARGREALLAFIERVQAAFNAIEGLRVPVIAEIQGACIGAGVDLIAACDMRLCTVDARFSIKEADLGVVPDVGTIQRLRHVLGYSVLAELSYTAQHFDGQEARKLGLVSQVHESPDTLREAVNRLAATIASKSPVALRGIKRNLLWARDRSVADGLSYVAAWNAAMMPGEDLRESLDAVQQKRAPSYGL